MDKLNKILNWLDINGLFLLSAFLIVFIPLFPKIPLFDVLPGYIVRARPEDVLIFITSLVWLKDAYKKRFQVSTTYFWIVVLYAISGAISILLATILIQSIPSQFLHIGKSSLHLFRYLEYFALFFFTYSSIKTKKQINIALTLLTLSILGVVLYGFGQEFFNLPLYSTMNREYSKGVTLYLQEGARPQSTFAGHYDLAAYLVIVLPIIFSLALSKLKINFKNFKQTIKQKTNLISIVLHTTHILGAWMLVTSGSKTALLAYIVGIFIVLIQYLKQLGNFKQQLKLGSLATIIITIGITLFLNFFAQDTKTQLTSLFNNTFRETDQLTNPDATPDDLVGDGYVFRKVINVNEDGSETISWVEEQSTWSQNALKYGLSMGIRLDTLWPNAVKGFANNPLFGNGYSTLPNVDSPGEYNNEDSTDNNYLRTLGETGLIGFIIFYGFIFLITFEIIKTPTEQFSLKQALKIGFLGSIFGLLINATYIDVFAASKVAYTFWTMAGLVLATLNPKPLRSIKKIYYHILKHWPFYITLIIALFLLHKNPLHKNSHIKELNVSNSQIESLTTAKCFLDTGEFTVCNSNGLVLKENFNLYSVLLVPIYKVFNNPMMFYLLNMVLFISSLLILYKFIPIIIIKYNHTKPKKVLVFSSLLIFTLIPTILGFSKKPLSTFELILFLLIIPVLIAFYTALIHNIKYRLAYFTQISAILVLVLFLINHDFNEDFLNQFRNSSRSNKFSTVNIQNIHVDNNRFLNRDKDYYIISTMNPYYVDLFSNKNFEVLPLSESQPYINESDKVYKLINNQTNLIDQYNKIVEDTNLYATDHGTQQNEVYSQAFEDLKNNFDLKYVAVGCEDSCSLYTVKPESIKNSPAPITLNSSLALKSLNSSYSFTVLSNRYEPTFQANQNQYSLNNFLKFLNLNISSQDNFSIITGDVINDDSTTNMNQFNQRFSKLPIVYSPGNFDINPIKVNKTKDSYFYTQSEFFLFLDIEDTSQISPDQRRYIYNALLEIEKLPNIQNIFVVSQNLNWQDRSNPNNFIFELERKLNQFPELNKYIVTSHHTNATDFEVIKSELTIKHITDSSTNINYLSSFIRGWENDSYLEFHVNSDNTVNIEYKLKGENF
jgi:hypothetical protein